MESDLPHPYEALSDPIEPVDPGDLRKVWDFCREAEARHPDQREAIDIDLLAENCPPGTNVPAIWYRCSMLNLMKVIGVLSPWMHAGQPDKAVFLAAATFPMRKMAVGVVAQGPPFDAEEFVKQVERQERK